MKRLEKENRIQPPLVLCIDLDDTLLDFMACVTECLQNSFSAFHLPYHEGIPQIFNRENEKLWRKLETGELDDAQFRKIRWNIIFSEMGITGITAEEFEDPFTANLQKTAVPVEEAFESLETLYKKGIPMYLATNGKTTTQSPRMEKAGFGKLIQTVLSSKDAGAKKPSPVFFSYAMDQIQKDYPGIEKEQIWMIGDSFICDILGAVHAGWNCIWFTNGKEVTEFPEEGKSDDLSHVHAASTWSEVMNILNRECPGLKN